MFHFCQDRNKNTAATFLAQEDIIAVLEERLRDWPEEILSDLAEVLER